MIFRAYTRGTLLELLDVTCSLLAEGKPGFLGWQWLYVGLATAGIALAALLFAAVATLGGQEAHQYQCDTRSKRAAPSR